MALIAILSRYTFIKDLNTEVNFLPSQTQIIDVLILRMQVPLQVAIGFTLSPRNGIHLSHQTHLVLRSYLASKL